MIDDIKNLKDEELVAKTGLQVIGTQAGVEAQEAQTEMMRRLKNSIEEFNKNTTRFNKFLISLTLILLVVAIMQVVVSILLAVPGWKGLIAEGTALILIFYFVWRTLHDFSDK